MRRSAAFQLETELGTRLVEFDPDVFRGRDVRILVDGARVAELPYPKAAAPYGEIEIEVDGHAVVAATWLAADARPEGAQLGYDLFADGRSLSDGASLADVRAAVSTPRTPYPTSFYFLDGILGPLPVVATSASIVAIFRNIAHIGWPRGIAVLAVVAIGGLITAASGSRIWHYIRGLDRQTVRRRAILGCVATLGCYIFALGLVFALIERLV